MPRLKTCKAPGCTVRKPREELLGPLHSFCSPDCGYALASLRQRQAADRRRLREARELRRRRDAVKTVGQLTKDAQREFNHFIRIRDTGMPCPTCGRTAGPWDCGHVRTVGAAPELRFNTRAAFRQCSMCNRGAAKWQKNDPGMARRYREWVIQTKGQHWMDWIDSHHAPRQYRDVELRRIARIFRRRARHYKKLRGADADTRHG